MKKALKDGNFLLLCGVAGLMMGIILTIKALVGQISFIYDYDLDQAAEFGMLFILGGILGSFIMGVFIAKYKNYKLCLQLLTCSTCLCLSMMYDHVRRKHQKAVAVWLFLLGVSLIPSIFISLDFAAEMTFPLNGTVSTGIIMIAGHFWSLIFTTATTMLIDSQGIHGAQVSFQIMAAGSLAALILSAPIESKLKRQWGESASNSEITPRRA